MPRLFSTRLTVSGCEKFLAHEKRGCALCADRPPCCVYVCAQLALLGLFPPFQRPGCATVARPPSARTPDLQGANMAASLLSIELLTWRQTSRLLLWPSQGMCGKNPIMLLPLPLRTSSEKAAPQHLAWNITCFYRYCCVFNNGLSIFLLQMNIQAYTHTHILYMTVCAYISNSFT